MVEQVTKLKGFKKTDIGEIPEDWILLSYGEIFDFLTTANYSRSQLNGDGEFGYVHYGDIHTKYDFFLDCNNELPSINRDQLKNYSLIQNGDIIVADASEDYAGVGKSVEVVNVKNRKIISGLHTFLLRDKNNLIANGFKGYLHVNEFVKKQMDTLATGLKVYGVSKANLKLILIPLPPTKEEQIAIATALSDTDALISNLKRLIDKKRLIKQGTMQELLKPKENWSICKLRNAALYRRGSFPQPYGLDKWYDDNFGMPFVQVFDVGENMKLKVETKRKISKEAQKMSVFVPKESILLTIQGSIGRIAITQYDTYVDRTLLFFERFSLPFNKYFFTYTIFQLFEKEKKVAPGGTIKTITKEVLSNFEISYPKIEEQTRIATILSDMDAEIEALEKKLEKYKLIKQGMMQSLLTGKIRLV